jgi:hypothetical protein
MSKYDVYTALMHGDKTSVKIFLKLHSVPQYFPKLPTMSDAYRHVSLTQYYVIANYDGSIKPSVKLVYDDNWKKVKQY